MFTVELLAGHKRWNLNLQEIFKQYGASIRESTDAVISTFDPNKQEEEAVLAMEFCNALPAGNNAWQRNGRALACVSVGIPYLFYGEVGGLELGEERAQKAQRFPNPIIPFSYLTAGTQYEVICVPIYMASPSASAPIREKFENSAGQADAKRVIRGILEGTSTDEPHRNLVKNALAMTDVLATQRKRVTTLTGSQWGEMLALKTAGDRAAWLENNVKAWVRKASGKVEMSPTFNKLLTIFRALRPVYVGATDIPICLIPAAIRPQLAAMLMELYGDLLSPQFYTWIGSEQGSLVVVWFTGFKPKGEDSRPDRGLAPLARMLFGNDIDLLSIVYGPARKPMWEMLLKSPAQLTEVNGLWDAIINLSDAVLVDSRTWEAGPIELLTGRSHKRYTGSVRFPAASLPLTFSEHDVDSTLHFLFGWQREAGVFESMCNPPGGDWSGISLLDFDTGQEYRWTSLKRVSGALAKRPDHITQFQMADGSYTLLAIESKDNASGLEVDVGGRLKVYTLSLVETPPTVTRSNDSDWSLIKEPSVLKHGVTMLSGGAFTWRTEGELDIALARCNLDVVIAVEFQKLKQVALLHVKVVDSAKWLLPKLVELVDRYGRGLEIQIH